MEHVRQEAANKVREANKRAQDAEDEYRSKEEHLREVLKQEKENYLQQHLEYVKKMEAEFGLIKMKNEEKAQHLTERYNEIMEAFEMRPSRPEDLELIQRLQEDNIIKTEDLRKAIEDLKVYKLELVNREDNYNKMFNSQPMVGVVNPLDFRKTKSSTDKGAGKGLPPIAGARTPSQTKLPNQGIDGTTRKLVIK